MNVKLIAHTPNARKIAFTAIRTCYSPNTPTALFEGEEYAKYEQKQATDGQGGTDTDRLFRHIVNSKHTSTLEHITFTFAIEGVSRACLAQLTRHRVGFSYSVQSQRYVSDASSARKGGFQYVIPPSIDQNDNARKLFVQLMKQIQETYDLLTEWGVPKEDARFVLPNATETNLILTCNLRALLDFYTKRRKGSGAQWEIAELAERMREEVVKAEPWIAPFFEMAGT